MRIILFKLMLILILILAGSCNIEKSINEDSVPPKDPNIVENIYKSTNEIKFYKLLAKLFNEPIIGHDIYGFSGLKGKSIKIVYEKIIPRLNDLNLSNIGKNISDWNIVVYEDKDYYIFYIISIEFMSFLKSNIIFHEYMYAAKYDKNKKQIIGEQY